MTFQSVTESARERFAFSGREAAISADAKTIRAVRIQAMTFLAI